MRRVKKELSMKEEWKVRVERKGCTDRDSLDIILRWRLELFLIIDQLLNGSLLMISERLDIVIHDDVASIALPEYRVERSTAIQETGGRTSIPGSLTTTERVAVIVVNIVVVDVVMMEGRAVGGCIHVGMKCPHAGLLILVWIRKRRYAVVLLRRWRGIWFVFAFLLSSLRLPFDGTLMFGDNTFWSHSDWKTLLQPALLTLPSHVHIDFTTVPVLALVDCVLCDAPSKESCDNKGR